MSNETKKLTKDTICLECMIGFRNILKFYDFMSCFSTQHHVIMDLRVFIYVSMACQLTGR